MIDLKQLAGKRWRVTLGKDDPDDMLFCHPAARQPRIPCQYGAVFAGRLEGARALCTNRRVIPRLADIPGAKPTHIRWEADGHVSELTVEFPSERLDEIASILKARKRRQISPEILARLAVGRSLLPARVSGV